MSFPIIYQTKYFQFYNELRLTLDTTVFKIMLDKIQKQIPKKPIDAFNLWVKRERLMIILSSKYVWGLIVIS